MDNYSSQRVIREVVNLGSDYATKIYRGFVDSFLSSASVTLDQWRLVKVEMLENGYFEEEFLERREEFVRQGYAKEEMTCNYGFLAAANVELVELALREGLKVRFCPINSLGYCIAGVHLCIHGDVCLQEATMETGDSDQMILVVFKFMFGRTRRLTPVTAKDMAIIAPSPGFNCHIADSRPAPADSMSDQYLRSLAYLYEFENSFYHPVSRPRQCCPLAAMHLRRKAGRPYPPKPPQFLSTSAGHLPATAVSQQPPVAQSLLRLAPSVADAVGSVLSELRQQQQQQQQKPHQQPPKLDGIRGFLKNATGGAAGSSSVTGAPQPLMRQHQPQPHSQALQAKQHQQQGPPPSLLLPQPEQPRRNAFLPASSSSSTLHTATAAADIGAGTGRFHPYARVQAAAAATAAAGRSGLEKFMRNSTGGFGDGGGGGGRK